LQSYSIYEKDNEQIENTLSTIKELVSKKLALLIGIIFAADQQNWFISLRIREEDSVNKKHYSSLASLVNQILNFSQPDEVPEVLIENFGQNLLSTPELIVQINKLVMKHFG
jgi:hypothetical protein